MLGKGGRLGGKGQGDASHAQGVMSGSDAHILNVIGADAFLRAGGPCMLPGCLQTRQTIVFGLCMYTL